MRQLVVILFLCSISLKSHGQDTRIAQMADSLFHLEIYSQAKYYYSLAIRKQQDLNPNQLERFYAADSLLAYSDTNQRNLQLLRQADSCYSMEQFECAYHKFDSIETREVSLFILKKKLAALKKFTREEIEELKSVLKFDQDSIEAERMTLEDMWFNEYYTTAEQRFFKRQYRGALVQYINLDRYRSNDHAKNRIRTILADSGHLRIFLLKQTKKTERPKSTNEIKDTINTQLVLTRADSLIQAEEFFAASLLLRNAVPKSTRPDLLHLKLKVVRKEMIAQRNDPYSNRNLKLRLENLKRLMKEKNREKAKEVIKPVDWTKVEDPTLQKSYKKLSRKLR